MNRLLKAACTVTGSVFLMSLIVPLNALLPMTSANAQDAGRSPIADIVEAWRASPHADRSSEAFTHWNEDGEIPGSCATCHSSIGAEDYLNGPMSTPGVIDHPVPLGTTVGCVVCHQSSAETLASVPFPSGVAVDSLGDGAVCAVCHQGRASSDRVNTATLDIEDDAVSAELGFINIHYAAAAASLMGSEARGGYQYEGKIYKGKFTHVPNLATCTDCHNPHTLEVAQESCSSCHQNISQFSDIRMSPIDFDGDGDTTEGIANPIATLHERLDVAIRTYAAEVAGTAIVYYSGSFPYFFTDSDGDGSASGDEAIYPNRYQTWTPRLLRAAYNYQVIAKDKAIYTHNPHYALQLLYDSLENLSEQVDVDMSGLVRP